MLAAAEHVPCNLCGADDAEPVLTKNGFTIVRCRRCTLAYVTPRPSGAALAALYGDERYYRNLNASPFGYPDYLGERWLLERPRRPPARRDRASHRRRGKLLDVGCATGVSSKLPASAGWTAIGVDISTFAASAVPSPRPRRATGRPADGRAAARALRRRRARRHDRAPRRSGRALAAIHDTLRPGGLVTLNTPNDGGWLRRLMGRHWFHCKPPEHLYYFSPRTIRALLERHGFTRGRDTALGKYVTVRYLCDRTKTYGGRARTRAHRHDRPSYRAPTRPSRCRSASS
jgi:SAM-dependent methyltransferase